jgi:hypothetical protein
MGKSIESLGGQSLEGAYRNILYMFKWLRTHLKGELFEDAGTY